MNIRHLVIKWLAKRCCANCKFKGKEAKYWETYDNYTKSSLVTGYQCTLNHSYLYEELNICEKWQPEHDKGHGPVANFNGPSLNHANFPLLMYLAPNRGFIDNLDTHWIFRGYHAVLHSGPFQPSL
jgi:hypothetical protein